MKVDIVRTNALVVVEEVVEVEVEVGWTSVL